MQGTQPQSGGFGSRSSIFSNQLEDTHEDSVEPDRASLVVAESGGKL